MFISTRRRIYGLWLIFCDVLSLAAAVYMSTVIRFGMTDAMRYLSVKIFPLFVNIGIFVAIFYLAGLYEPKRFDNHIKIFITVVLSVFAGMLLSSFVFYADLSLKIGRGVFVLNSFLLMIFVSLSRFLFVVTAKKRILDRKIIIVGNEEASRDVITLIHKYASSLYRVVGIINGNSVDGKAEVDGYKLLGPIEETGDLIKRREVDAIVVTSLEPKRRRVLENLRVCRYRGIEIIDVVSLYEELEGQVPLKYIDDEWLFSSSAKYPGFHVRKIKRLVDIIGSLAGLILAVPFCVIAAVLIKLDSRGPVFYRQKRLGRFGKPFRVLKFRSMIRRAERGMGGPVWAQEHDSRITRIGWLMRKLRIDEIPQLLNVLAGDMSLVGPRPERSTFVKELSEKIPFYPERLYVQPGLTGWAQINYSYASTIEESETKLQYDLYYIKHVSFFLDMLIILKTLKIVLFGHGSR